MGQTQFPATIRPTKSAFPIIPFVASPSRYVPFRWAAFLNKFLINLSAFSTWTRKLAVFGAMPRGRKRNDEKE
jgi:hypothetical protein